MNKWYQTIIVNHKEEDGKTTHLLDDENYKILCNEREEQLKEIERLTISLQAQEELTMNEHIKVEKLRSIIKEVREYITSYESIETIQQCEHSENNKGLDNKTMIEMDRRYLIVHDKILNILDKENK